MRILKNYNIKPCHKPSKIVRSRLYQMQAKRKTKNQAGVYISLNVMISPKRDWIRETVGQLKARKKEHKDGIL